MTRPATRTRRTDWAWFAGVCLFAILLRIPIAAIPLERDEGEYAYIAQRWMQGDLPYRDAFNQKLPGAFVAYAVIERVFGTTPSAIHWGTHIYTLGTLALLFVLGRRLSSTAGGLAASAFAAVMIADASVLGNAANTEVFMLLPLTGAMLAACLAVERDALGWAFGAGVLSAAALLCKQVALPNVAFYGLLMAVATRRRVNSALLFLLGVSCMLLPVVGYFALHGALYDFYDATIGHNLRYAAQRSLAAYPSILWRGGKPFLYTFWPLMLLAVAQVGSGVWGVGGRVSVNGGRARHPTPHTPHPTPRSRRPTLLVLAWFAASFLGTASGGYFEAHYFMQLIPPLAMLAGMCVHAMNLPGLTRLGARPARAVLVAAVILVAILGKPWYYLPGDPDAKARRLYGNNPFVESAAVGRFLAAHSEPADTIFVLGSEPQILYYAERKSASRYIIAYPLVTAFADARERQHVVIDELQRLRPRLIVTVFVDTSFGSGSPDAPTDLLETVWDTLQASYRFVAVVPFATDGSPHLVTGEEAQQLWARDPEWYGRRPWCSLAIWERKDTSAAEH